MNILCTFHVAVSGYGTKILILKENQIRPMKILTQKNKFDISNSVYRHVFLSK